MLSLDRIGMAVGALILTAAVVTVLAAAIDAWQAWRGRKGE